MISYVGLDYCGNSHGGVVVWYHILMVVLRVVIVEKYLTVELVQAHVTRGGVCLSGLIVHHFWCARLVAICEHVGVMDLYRN